MRKKRILLMTDKFFPFVGGIEVMSFFLANYLKEEFEVKVVTWTQDNTFEKFDFQVIRNPKKTYLFKLVLWSDLVIENNPAMKLSWPLLLIYKPLIIVLHTWISRSNGKKSWQDYVKIFWLRRANKLITVSNALKNSCGLNATVIRNPYNSQLFKRIDKIKRNLDFVFLGRLVSDKGAHLAIRLISDLTKKGINNKLTIIGNGPEYKNLKDLVKSLSLNEYVRFTGKLTGTELVESLNQHDFILVPSIWEEPFGLVALEGMACGCIPIVSNSGGLNEAIGNAGVIFDKNNTASLLNKTLSLLNNDALQKRLREDAAQHLKRHEQHVIGKEYLKIINEVLQYGK